jgi:ribosomal protein S18 acetylase RimI-like enzyme
MTVQIHHGLPDALRDAAAALYWEAFGAKLGRVMGPTPKALAFLGRSLRSNHAVVAVSADGALLGIAGFKSYTGSFAGGDWADLRAAYGLAGAAWRAAVLSLLQRDVENERFLMDGICVCPQARGQGVGTLLLDAICTEARARHYAAVRLDVIDTNPRARALYERLGFVVGKTDQMGPLRHIFGFAAATTMIKTL